jgi:ketosteroid isomerase-like protein
VAAAARNAYRGGVHRGVAVELLRGFHQAQGAFYAGGPPDDLRSLLTQDVCWHVPGNNPIAGRYEGLAAVMDYFARRRELASRSFRMFPGDVLVGDGPRVAVLTDGTARLGGRDWRWSTVGLYEFSGERVATCWLLPLDQEAFDAAWRAATVAR